MFDSIVQINVSHKSANESCYGYIIHEKGYILTVAHAFYKLNKKFKDFKIDVSFSDGKTSQANLLEYYYRGESSKTDLEGQVSDPHLDYAILNLTKIRKNLSPAKLELNYGITDEIVINYQVGDDFSELSLQQLNAVVTGRHGIISPPIIIADAKLDSNEGYSGSPATSLSTNRVLAHQIWIEAEQQNIIYLLPIRRIFVNSEILQKLAAKNYPKDTIGNYIQEFYLETLDNLYVITKYFCTATLHLNVDAGLSNDLMSEYTVAKVRNENRNKFSLEPPPTDIEKIDLETFSNSIHGLEEFLTSELSPFKKRYTLETSSGEYNYSSLPSKISRLKDGIYGKPAITNDYEDKVYELRKKFQEILLLKELIIIIKFKFATTQIIEQLKSALNVDILTTKLPDNTYAFKRSFDFKTRFVEVSKYIRYIPKNLKNDEILSVYIGFFTFMGEIFSVDGLYTNSKFRYNNSNGCWISEILLNSLSYFTGSQKLKTKESINIDGTRYFKYN